MDLMSDMNQIDDNVRKVAKNTMLMLSKVEEL